MRFAIAGRGWVARFAVGPAPNRRVAFSFPETTNTEPERVTIRLDYTRL